MADPNIKQIKLTPTEPQQGGTRKRAKTPKKKFELPTVSKEGGGSTSPGTMTQLATSHVTTPIKTPDPVGVNSPLTQVGTPVVKQSAGAKPTPVQPVKQTAGAPVKVVLGELKKKPKVVLAAAKAKAPVQTRKNKAARKVRVSMVSLSRKIHRATDIRKKASEDKIEEIKKALQKAELIKADSKAPEIMLRQMYADFMMLKKRAL